MGSVYTDWYASVSFLALVSHRARYCDDMKSRELDPSTPTPSANLSVMRAVSGKDFMDEALVFKRKVGQLYCGLFVKVIGFLQRCAVCTVWSHTLLRLMPAMWLWGGRLNQIKNQDESLPHELTLTCVSTGEPLSLSFHIIFW